MIENEITGRILKCAFKVHTVLGPGLLESLLTRNVFFMKCGRTHYMLKKRSQCHWFMKKLN